MTALMPLADVQVLNLGCSPATAFCSRLLAQLGSEVHFQDLRETTEDRSSKVGRFDLIVTDLQMCEPQQLLIEIGKRVNSVAVVVSITPFGLGSENDDHSVGESILALCRSDVAAALCGAHAALAAVAALRSCRRDDERRCVEVATVEVLAMCLGGGLARESCPRRHRLQVGNDPINRELFVLACADGFIGAMVATDDDRALLATMTGVEALREPTANISELLESWLEPRARAQIFETAQSWRLPIVPVLTPDEVRCDEQSQARQLWLSDDGVETGVHSPFRFTFLETPGVAHIHSALQPLSDISVLDLGMVWAGPYCGRLLAGLGAQVTKVEGPTRTDGTRPQIHGGCDGVFADLNRGKSSLVLDLTSGIGRKLFLELSAGTDVVLENFSPRVMPNLGLEFATLAVANSRLVMLSMPAFGASGPWAHFVAYGSNLELVTGLTGYEEGRPVPSTVAYLDYLTGCCGALGVVAALRARDRFGRGAHLEVAQREVACQLLAAPFEGQACGPALSVNPATVVRDPQLTARGLLNQSVSGRSACLHYARLPFQLHGVPERYERPAPVFGADSRRLLMKAGLSAPEIDHLVTAGIVGEPEQRARPS